MTTTTTFQGMEPGAKNSSRVLRPPGGGSNITLGADEEKPPVRKNKMASSVFAEPEDPYANRRNNPPGGKPMGILCGEHSAPLRRGVNHGTNHTGEAFGNDGDNAARDADLCLESRSVESDAGPEQLEEPPPADDAAAGAASGRRNPPGGKSSLILG